MLSHYLVKCHVSKTIWHKRLELSFNYLKTVVEKVLSGDVSIISLNERDILHYHVNHNHYFRSCQSFLY